jgi:hypothetical protein
MRINIQEVNNMSDKEFKIVFAGIIFIIMTILAGIVIASWMLGLL